LSDDESHFDRFLRLKKRVRDIDRRLEDREKSFLNKVDVSIRKGEERQQKLIEQVGADVKDLQWRMEELKRKCENDIQYMDSKLSMIDDSTVMKKWVN
jgi:seryl-tRNA synthetase